MRLVCLSFGPVIAIIALVSAAVVACSSRSVSMIAYCLGPRSGHLVSTVGSSLSAWGTAAVTGMTTDVAAANRPSSASSSESHPLYSQPSNCSLCCELSQS